VWSPLLSAYGLPRQREPKSDHSNLLPHTLHGSPKPTTLHQALSTFHTSILYSSFLCSPPSHLSSPVFSMPFLCFPNSHLSGSWGNASSPRKPSWLLQLPVFPLSKHSWMNSCSCLLSSAPFSLCLLWEGLLILYSPTPKFHLWVFPAFLAPGQI
jgi:hypothetical protein